MIQKVLSDHLTLGMYIHQLDRPYLETPFLSHRFVIKTQKQIDQLRQYCTFVYIDTEKGKAPKADSSGAQPFFSEPPPPGSEAVKKKSAPSFILGADGLRKAIMVRNQTKKVITTVLEDIRLGQSIKTDEAQKAVNSIIDSLMEDKEALLCLSQLKSRDEYTVFHSLNVLILSVAFAKQLGLGVDDLQLIGLGGLLHDIGKMKIPLEILNKPGKLTDSEFVIMKNHVLLSKEIIEKSGDFPQKTMDFVLHHHERYNGKGYPFGLTGEAISLFGRIAAIVDVYDAITSDRVYHSALATTEAIKKIFEWSKTDFDQSLVEHFIKTIGIYPTGSIVEINQSDVGMVVSNNQENALKPSVLLLWDKQKHKYQPPRLIDLQEQLPDRNKPLWAVSRVFGPFKEEYTDSLLARSGQEGPA